MLLFFQYLWIGVRGCGLVILLFGLCFFSGCAHLRPPSSNDSPLTSTPSTSPLMAQQGLSRLSVARQKQVFRLRRDIQRQVVRKKIQGVSIVLVDREGVLWVEGFGYQNPLDVDKGMQIGSLTKSFTAMAVMQLVEQNRLDLDAPVSDYLPALRQSYLHRYTARQLLLHRSGLWSDYWKHWRMPASWEARWQRQFRTLPQSIAPYRPPYAPNEVFSYSNLGYSLLASVIENITHQTFVEYMQQNILSRLAMTGASLLRPPADLLPRVDGRNRQDQSVGYLRIRDLAAASMTVSTRQLGLLLQCLLNNGCGLVSPETFAVMTTDQGDLSPLDGDRQMGLGFYLNRFWAEAPTPQWSHDGRVSTFTSQYVVFPEKNLGFAILTNDSAAASLIAPLVRKAIKSLKVAPLGESEASHRDGPALAPVTARTPFKKITPGYYATSIGMVKLEARRNMNKLGLQYGERRLSLVQKKSGQYQLRYKVLGLIPLSLGPLKEYSFRTIKGRERELILAQHHEFPLGLLKKVEPQKISKKWMDRIGQYVAENDALSYVKKLTLQFDSDSGFLLVKNRNRLYPVVVQDDYRIKILGVGRYLGEVIYWREGGLFFSGLRFIQKNDTDNT